MANTHLQSLKYHFAITTAMLARYCIDAGMEVSEAFALSDYYIQKVDSLISEDEISKLHSFLCLDYTKRMKALRKEHTYSIQTKKCLEYIYDHLHTRITVPVLAEYVNLSPNYLSRLFKQETGLTISAYIQNKKIETAQNMLSYSDYTVSEIALTLAFPDQSYFSALFKRHTGITPNTYRKKHYQKRTQLP